MKRIAFYPGSFDPLTNGHVDILQQSFALFDEIVIGIGVQASKKPLFEFDERAELIRASLGDVAQSSGVTLKVVAFQNLAVDAARENHATVMLRGLRDGTDLDYEMQMAGMNGTMAPDVKTVFLPSSPQVRPITATLVRQIAKMGGDVSPFVPNPVRQAMDEKFN